MADEVEPSGETAECERVGVPNPPIAGIGIIVAFAGQAFISLILAIWVFFLSKNGRLDVNHGEGTVEHAVEVKRLESILDILMVGNDIQMLTGIALMITAFTDADDLDLYHLHLIYDIVSFVGVSSAAALVTWTFCVTKHPNSTKYARPPKLSRTKATTTTSTPNLSKTKPPTRLLSYHHRATYLFALLFLAQTILLLVSFKSWSTSPTAPLGSCYITSNLLSAPGASHPAADRIYIAITAVWLLAVLFFAIFGGAKHRRSVLLIALLQFPVHLYAVIALRTGNQTALEKEGGDEEGENVWDFGQTTAVLLLGVTVHECVSKGREIWRFEREARGRGKVEGERRVDEGGIVSERRDVEAAAVVGEREG